MKIGFTRAELRLSCCNYINIYLLKSSHELNESEVLSGKVPCVCHVTLEME